MKRLIVFLFVPSLSLASCDVPAALLTLTPGAQWNLRGDTYAGVEWLDRVQTQPTQAQVAQAIANCQTQAPLRSSQKVQAKLDVKNNGLTQAQRLQALLILLDYDQ